MFANPTRWKPQPDSVYLTLHVLGGAYRGRDLGERSLLSHLVETRDGRSVGDKTVCKKVPLVHVVDEGASMNGGQDLADPPTCALCRERYDLVVATIGRAEHTRRAVEHYDSIFGEHERNGYQPNVSRVWIENGYLIQPNELEDTRGNTYVLSLEYEVYELNGERATGNYRGPGTVNSNGHIVLGDPYTHTTLSEVKYLSQPTSESWDYYLGFKAALADRREAVEGKPTKAASRSGTAHYANSIRWWEGYRDGWREKREHAQRGKTLKANESSYYVWVLRGDTPMEEGPYGPYDLDQAKDYARISATEGKHDRAVSRGRDASSESFEFVRRYRAHTGERIL